MTTAKRKRCLIRSGLDISPSGQLAAALGLYIAQELTQRLEDERLMALAWESAAEGFEDLLVLAKPHPEAGWQCSRCGGDQPGKRPDYPSKHPCKACAAPMCEGCRSEDSYCSSGCEGGE